MSSVRRDDATVRLEPGSVTPDGPDTPHARSLESEVLLARARARLLARPELERPVTIGRYVITGLLGRGGMGIVYAARDHELDRAVAIKVLHAKWAQRSEGRARLVREAQAMARLSHPNVGHVYEVGMLGDQPFIAMELVRGETLRAWGEARARPWREIVAMHVQAGEGLAAAHAVGLVHRDYKLDNVIVGEDGRPRVLDFGLARDDSDLASLAVTDGPSSSPLHAEITQSGTVLGTPAYMAPEQHDGGPVDARADQYAFCVALFEALTGRRPARDAKANDPDRIAKGVPMRLHAALLRGLEEDPDDRFASMRQLLAELRAAAEPRKVAPRATIAVLTTALAATAGVLALRDDDTATTEPTTEQTVEPTDPWTEIVAASALPPEVPEPLAHDPARVTVHRLPNGLTVYVAPRPEEPMVHVRVVVRAGPADENPDAPGLAFLTMAAVLDGSSVRLGSRDVEAERADLQRQHETIARYREETDPAARARLLEMLASLERTSEHSVPGATRELLEELGVREFTTTGDSATALSGSVPRNQLSRTLAVLADTLRDPAFRRFGAVTARHLEDLPRFVDGQYAEVTIDRELRDATGENRDPIAEAEYVRTLPLADVKRFHETFYRPNNTALVLVGDVSAAETLGAVEAAFGGWEPAHLPPRRRTFEPLAASRTIDIVDSGSSKVLLAWPLPAATSRARSKALRGALGGPDGLLGSAFAALGRSDAPMTGLRERSFVVGAWPSPGESLADLQRALEDAMAMVAADRLPDAAWDPAIARYELQANEWARSLEELADLVGTSFADGMAWADRARELADPGVTRAELIAATSEMLEHGHLAIRQAKGPAFALSIDPLPGEDTPRAESMTYGAFAREILDRKVTPLEPRFLLEGHHFQRRRGSAEVITAAWSGPLFRVQWIYPVGAAEDPWICLAVRAREELAMRDVGLHGVELRSDCKAHETSIEAVGVARRFDALWPALQAYVAVDALPAASLETWVGRELQEREQERLGPFVRATALHGWAMLGATSMHALLPDDATLQREGPDRIARALHDLVALRPDVLYAGPDPAGFSARVPPAEAGERIAPRPPEFRTVDRPTVYWLVTPEESDTIDVRVTVVPPDDGTELLARIVDELTRPSSAEKTVLGEYGLERANDSCGRGRRPIVSGFRGSSALAEEAVELMLHRLHRAPTDAAMLAARDQVEQQFRRDREPPFAIPEYVRTWEARGVDTDPRLREWMALPRVDLPTVEAYVAKLRETAPIITVVGSVEAFGAARLDRFGDVVRVPIDALVRDTSFEDADLFRVY